MAAGCFPPSLLPSGFTLRLLRIAAAVFFFRFISGLCIQTSLGLLKLRHTRR